MSELAQINCASSERVTNFFEKTVSTWNDLVSAAKSSKECTPTNFSQILSFLRNFSMGEAFTSYDWPYSPNWLKWTVPPLKGRPISQRKISFLETIWYRLQKVPKSASRTIFDKFWVFWGIFEKHWEKSVMEERAGRIVVCFLIS